MMPKRNLRNLSNLRILNLLLRGTVLPLRLRRHHAAKIELPVASNDVGSKRLLRKIKTV
jgi:hypothetical protein